ncbi:MAG: imidazole glycerol phosphate synthase subunit HisH [Desulfomonilia bacterium]|jgi:glutamine amidotransferase|uniref:Imidazole glycerol phosphate synthase subunit HisH n=1 Tax=anaerobic digester metagenome TaxID=1263854 RepID=A0A485M3P3_9ZZZZ|nr:imidazole glycerol phosphate synthase subunit HisH [Pseudomonadota bacterium]HON37974.1 imidazole glycerol phosphate synthase subunit HisH [Deltaproteobacteria bacterium]HRS56719.1 imidazole glycerol phosphate synthase subunit HisH [Desulfomonilia bacterium]HPD21289.1 imidazole glycerol phosphate synthase subunit HisH [Deltaproteobacteria bacterium]HPX19108.1 imidazole glycerol phosphate synthase subunit HisH [Deltaproteobacteria bacterium]
MIAIIDYRAGNLRSVERACRHLNLDCRITSSPQEIRDAERVIFPGVGAAGKAMETIISLRLDDVIREVADRGTPFLGICLGTQIILDQSREDDARCLGIIPGMVERFPATMGVKIPHMGWNTIEKRIDHPLLAGLDPRSQFYFVHSYYPKPLREDDAVAYTFYGIRFASMIARDNVAAVQFHPEKSGRPGLDLIKNFSRWDGRA